jgi:glucokinase
MKVLAGDIGGTHTRLALFEGRGKRLACLAERTYPSRDYPGLEAIVGEFLAAGAGGCERAAFGIAGPVEGGRSETTNLPWVVEVGPLAALLGTDAVFLLNDLEATAYGVGQLAPESLTTLQPGRRGASGNAAVIAAGTGLGEAGLYWDGHRHHPYATEGGHADFAPRGELEVALWRYLAEQHEHVSWERVVSGPGLVNVYRFLGHRRGGEEPAALAAELAGDDPAAAISQAALAGRSPLASEALEVWIRLYGAEAGNLALKVMATGGVYLGGGIAPRIVSRLAGPTFREAFLAKGRMRPLLEAIPVRVILDDHAALLGAAHFARLGARP